MSSKEEISEAAIILGVNVEEIDSFFERLATVGVKGSEAGRLLGNALHGCKRVPQLQHFPAWPPKEPN